VYGPGATTWVVRPLQSIKNDHIALINNGSGIFLHTYIDNLLDALIIAATKGEVVGESIDVTDGDHSVTWGMYLNDLARIIDKDPISRNLSKRTAMFIGRLMMVLHKITGMDPWVTPQAVATFTNTHKVSIDQAKILLGYEPKIGYEEGFEKVKEWVNHHKDDLNI
jgi:nucleoside-diphosphate-sugar epimerase